MKPRLMVSALLVGGLACGRSAPEPQVACSVVVRDGAAAITFPLLSRTSWIWNRPPHDPTSPVPNYWWSVYLYPGPGLHVEVSRAAHGPEQRGDLATMLRQARVVVTWPSSSGGEFDDFRDVDSPKVLLEHGRVVVAIRDTMLLRELFVARHPASSRCDFHADGEAAPEWVWGTVRYVRSNAPRT